MVSFFSKEVGLKMTYGVTAVKLPVAKRNLGTGNGCDGGEGSGNLHFDLHILVVN